jgi:hypothetical protein
MAGMDLDAGQVDLPGPVFDIQHADGGLPGGDDLPPVRVEGALVKRALDLFVPPPDGRDVLAHGGLMRIKNNHACPISGTFYDRGHLRAS